MLVLDTCFDGCSAALFAADGTSVLAHRFETMQRGHAERLPVMVDEVLQEAGVMASVLTRVAVTRGPGTFTGLRIGLSYAKGLGLALSIPVIGIDSLTATALSRDPGFRRNDGIQLVVAHKAGGTGLHYAARFGAEEQAPALIDDATLAQWAKGAHLLQDQVPDAASFGAQALALNPDDRPAQPLYLREADAKPNAPPSFSRMMTRPASLDDVALMAKLHGESFDVAWTTEMIASSLSLPGSGAIIVELANRAYGFVQYQWVAGEAEINTICVSNIYRRQGFGRALMDALIAHLKQHKTAKLFLEVAADNVPARALYWHYGFEETGLRKAYYARTSGAVDAITMSLPL